MQTPQPSLFARDDTFFGVCQGLGEDLGFNPDYLRVALPLLLFFYPVPTIVGYAGAGAVLFVTRWFYPEPRVAADVQAQHEPVEVDQDWVQLAA